MTIKIQSAVLWLYLRLFHRKELTSDKPGWISWGREWPRSQLLLYFVKCMWCIEGNSLLNVRVYSHRWLALLGLAMHEPVHGHFFFAMRDVLPGVRARQLLWTEWQTVFMMLLSILSHIWKKIDIFIMSPKIQGSSKKNLKECKSQTKGWDSV